jgi:hypothetical protein
VVFLMRIAGFGALVRIRIMHSAAFGWWCFFALGFRKFGSASLLYIDLRSFCLDMIISSCFYYALRGAFAILCDFSISALGCV